MYPKKGNLNDDNNYRAITPKNISLLLDNRLRKWSEDNIFSSDNIFNSALGRIRVR